MESLKLFDVDFGYVEFQIQSFENEKEYRKFINKTKRVIRSSFEYIQWLQFIKETKGGVCYFTDELGKEVSIEIHHHPYTLEDYVIIIIEKNLENDELFTSYDIAKEVMELHYKDLVGYIPLIKSLHEKYHNGFLEIPINLVEGNWRELINLYHIPDDIKMKVQRLSQFTSDNNLYKWSRDHYPAIQNVS